MESWRLVWRDSFAKILPVDGLIALAEALRKDDDRLTQGSVPTPPHDMCQQDWPCGAGCALGLCGAVTNGGFGTAKVSTCEEFVAKACYDADQMMGEPAACRWFLNWFDDTPRDEMRRELLPEVELAIAERTPVAA